MWTIDTLEHVELRSSNWARWFRLVNYVIYLYIWKFLLLHTAISMKNCSNSKTSWRQRQERGWQPKGILPHTHTHTHIYIYLDIPLLCHSHPDLSPLSFTCARLYHTGISLWRSICSSSSMSGKESRDVAHTHSHTHTTIQNLCADGKLARYIYNIYYNNIYAEGTLTIINSVHRPLLS